MRPVDKDAKPSSANGTEIIFPEYPRARRYLIETIGEYCSYCERFIPTSLAVEHIQPKEHNKHLELVWSNLLLACTNCNSTKGYENVVLADCFWPDRDNTYDSFVYDISGLVKPCPQLDSDRPKKIKAKKLIGLVGLGKIPPKIGTKKWEEGSDRRYEQRLQTYIEAYSYAEKYRNASVADRKNYLPFLITIAKKGFWSIWMHAFEEFPEVQKELILNFKGTRLTFFQNILNPQE